MNKKGVVAKILSTMAVFLLIVFIMGIFILLSVFAVGVKKESVPLNVEGINLNNLILGDMDIKIGEGKKSVSFIDAYIFYKKGMIEDVFYFSGIEKMILNNDLDNYCLIFYSLKEESFLKEPIYHVKYLNKDRRKIFVYPEVDFGEYKLLIDYPEDVQRQDFSFSDEELALYYSSGKIHKISVFYNNADGEQRENLYAYYGECLK